MDRDSVFLNAYAAPTMEYDDNFKCIMNEKVYTEISNQITKKLLTVFPDKPILVTRRVIVQALEYSMLNRYSYNFNFNDVINTVINSITQQIIDERTAIEQNDKLDTWIIKYDGSKGLRAHSTIRLNNKGLSIPVSWNGRY